MGIGKLSGILPSLHPINLVILFSGVAFLTEANKNRQFDSELYNILKDDIVNVYKQPINQYKQQPVLGLLKERRNEIDPQLRKRLQLYAEWQKDDIWAVGYRLSPILIPAIFSALHFKVLMSLTTFAFAVLTMINYENQKQIISGGKIKSFWVKDKVPKQQKIQQAFTYFSCGMMGVALLRLSLLRYNLKLKDKIIKEWRDQHKK